MLPEDHIVIQVDDIHDIIRVVLLKELEDLELDASLIIVLLLVFYYFNGDFAVLFMILTFESGSKTTFAKEVFDLISEAYVISGHDRIVSFIVIVAVVVFQGRTCVDFLSCWRSNKVDFRILKNFLLFIFRELIRVKVKGLLGCHGELGDLKCFFR
jgi:hypothetical protein